MHGAPCFKFASLDFSVFVGNLAITSGRNECFIKLRAACIDPNGKCGYASGIDRKYVLDLSAILN